MAVNIIRAIAAPFIGAALFVGWLGLIIATFFALYYFVWTIAVLGVIIFTHYGWMIARHIIKPPRG